MNEKTVNIVGAGLSGLSAAITLSRMGIHSRLVSSQPSERAQSVLAEGGINAALDTMGESDTPADHFSDTMKGGCFLESEAAIKELTENAPRVVTELFRLGTPFQNENGRLTLRNFGGQKKKRTAYAKSSTGKMIMTALIDEVRKYEAQGLVERFPHHDLVYIKTDEKTLQSIFVKDLYTGEFMSLGGCTILCTGGLNGFFEGMTTGTTQNTGNAAALAFGAGAELANLEFIQYHPTTVAISGKRMLISEAARGEGGKLFIMKNGKPWYFMEEKYELGSLMPRDVVSREMFFVKNASECTGDVFLDMTTIGGDVWSGKLSDLRKEIVSYLKQDPKKEPIAVSPGIHFFMGGIRVNDRFETNIKGLFAAGEAACKFHGANRLGGNSMLGAVFGGETAARAASKSAEGSQVKPVPDYKDSVSSPQIRARLRDLLLGGLGIVRSGETMKAALAELEALYSAKGISKIDRLRVSVGIAAVESALAREESRGAHFRKDFPKTSEAFRRQTVARLENGRPVITFEKIGGEGALKDEVHS